MSFCAAGERVEGRWYRTSFIHLYVSFRSRVSNGGLPHISVYLREINQRGDVKHKKNSPLRSIFSPAQSWELNQNLTGQNRDREKKKTLT